MLSPETDRRRSPIALYLGQALLAASCFATPAGRCAAEPLTFDFIRDVRRNELLYRDIDLVMRTIRYPHRVDYQRFAGRLRRLDCHWWNFSTRGEQFFISQEELLNRPGFAPTKRLLKYGFDGVHGWTTEGFEGVVLRDDKPPHPPLPLPHRFLTERLVAESPLSETLAAALDSGLEPAPDVQDAMWDELPCKLLTFRVPSSREVRLWMPSKYNWIPAKFELVANDDPPTILASGVTSDWSELAPGAWFPYYTSVTQYRGGDVVERFVEQATLSPVTVRSAPPIVAGRWVEEFQHGQSIGRRLLGKTERDAPLPNWVWMLVVNDLLLVAVVVYCWRRAVWRLPQTMIRLLRGADRNSADRNAAEPPAAESAASESAASEFDDVTRAYLRRHPHDSAYLFLGVWQKLFYLLLLQGVIYLLLTNWLVLVTLFTFLASLLYIGCILFRLSAVCLSLSGKGLIQVTPDELTRLSESDLPVYTVLVPLYKEANIARSIVTSLSQLDYPAEKLDIKLLLEEDDAETIEAVRRTSLGDQYDVIIVGNSQPKTKPKACNHGLATTRGQYCVIFDAEDQPEPDQLKKAVYAFQHVDKDVVCLQAKLNYRNPRQNMLTRWFTIEYTMWYDLLLPGLKRLGAPIPLGGTSNHFRTDVLQELDGWDPFNVTEDCDLGIRISKAGRQTAILESTTWEEANSEVRNWINQRSRWMKGFFQTHIAHMRRPWRLLWSLGPWRLICFWLSVGGVSLTMVLNLVFWAVGACYLVLLAADWWEGRELWQVIAGHRNEARLAWKMVFLGGGESPWWSAVSLTLFTMGGALLLSNGIFILINCLACLKRGNKDLIGAALLSPFYWVLISIGAWKGFVQLYTNRFYWEKTAHGLSGMPQPDVGDAGFTAKPSGESQ